MSIVTREQLRTMDRFELIALWLVDVTRTKAGRRDVGGLKVTHRGGVYSVVSPEVAGVPALFHGSADRLFDFARRTALNAQIRVMEDARASAHAA
jgi:hypothetical protein